MQALEFWKEVTADKANFLEQFVSLLADNEICYCIIGGQAVNAYVEPLVSLDLDVVVATDQLDLVRDLLAHKFNVKSFPHSLNVSMPDSKLRVQIRSDPRYFDFVERSQVRDVLDLKLPVASLEDVMWGKVWTAQDPARRGSKRQKDLTHILRLLESYPHLRDMVPSGILRRLND